MTAKHLMASTSDHILKLSDMAKHHQEGLSVVIRGWCFKPSGQFGEFLSNISYISCLIEHMLMPWNDVLLEFGMHRLRQASGEVTALLSITK